MNKRKIIINNNSKNEIININNKIFDFYLFSKEGICILDSPLFKLFNDEIKYNKFKLLLKNVCYNFFKNNKKYDNFTFETIILEKFKVTILLKNTLALVGIFPLLSSKSYQHMLLIHLFIALINYKGDSISKIDSISQQIKFDKNNLDNIKTLFNNNFNSNNNNNSQCSIMDNNDLLEMLIFQQYFLNLLFSHFTNVYNIIFKRETMNLGGTKLKNLYIIDASNNSILFDLRQTQNRKSNYKYYKKDLLRKEILFQANKLYQYYLNSYKNNNSKTKTKYLLFECTSTFPRLLFIFKFIPVLKGLIVIHLYHQKKLSQKKTSNYHETEITFCSPENHNKNSQEFQYCEPKKLVLINKFLEEFYLTTRKIDLFRIVSNDKKFKYFNYLAINAINSISMKDSINTDIDAIFNAINEKIDEQILESNKKPELITNTDENNFDKILDIDVSNYYKKENNNYENEKKENNEIKYELPYNYENSDINMRYTNENQSESNYALTKKNISIIIDNNLSEEKTKYFNHFENIHINHNININNNSNHKKLKGKMIDSEISDSMNLTNIDFVTKNYEKSNYGSSKENFSLISEVEKNSINNLKEVEIHKNNKLSSAKKKGRSNINIMDLLDISNMRSYNFNKNASKKIIQESEENRLDELNEEDNDKNFEQLSTSQFIEKGNTKNGIKLRTKLALFDADKIKN